MRAKLTKRVVDSVEPVRDIIIWDTMLPGFGVKITPAGRRSYLNYRAAGGRSGTLRKPAIGVHGAITCEGARDIAKAWLREVAAGRDPGQRAPRMEGGLRTP